MKTSEQIAGAFVICVLAVCSLFALCSSTVAAQVHVWEKVEIELTAQSSRNDPYMNVDVWVDLEGPEFSKRVWGFWDGGSTYRVRMMATKPGVWNWTSGANVDDFGLRGKSGSFTAIAWTEAEKNANPNRRGIIRASGNGHTLSYADGTPFLLLSDTHWAASTWRYPFKNEIPDPNYVPKSGCGFEQFIQHLKKKGFNSVGMITCYPNWDHDQYGRRLSDNAGVEIRNGWKQAGDEGKTQSMHDEDGNRPFMFPGKCNGKQEFCADFGQINPVYWQNFDRKMDYMHANGFVPYCEALRRDVIEVWQHYYDFNTTFSRFLQYLQARYNTINWVFSLFHFDNDPKGDILTQFKNACNTWFNTYPQPYHQMTTAMGGASTLKNMGHVSDEPWLRMHAVQGGDRAHGIINYLRDCFNKTPYVPCWNSEPYYTGYFRVPAGELPPLGGERDSYFGRAHLWGNILNGGLAGHNYGSLAWIGATTGEPDYKDPRYADHFWETFAFEVHGQVRHIAKFLLSEDTKYQDLLLASDDLDPSRSPAYKRNNLDGLASMMRTKDKALAVIYFENKCNKATVNNMKPDAKYEAQWFNPRTGEWSDIGSGTLTANSTGKIALPNFPGDKTATSLNKDWAVKLVLRGASQPIPHPDG
jgi:hypothetical protein